MSIDANNTQYIDKNVEVTDINSRFCGKEVLIKHVQDGWLYGLVVGAPAKTYARLLPYQVKPVPPTCHYKEWESEMACGFTPGQTDRVGWWTYCPGCGCEIVDEPEEDEE